MRGSVQIGIHYGNFPSQMLRKCLNDVSVCAISNHHHHHYMIRPVSKSVCLIRSTFVRFNSVSTAGDKKGLNESISSNSSTPPVPATASTGSAVAPPTFFHNQTNLPEKMVPVETDLTKSDQDLTTTVLAAVGAKTGASLTPPPTPPPRSIFSTSEDKARDTRNYFEGYKDFCKGMAYIGIGMATLFFLFDQYERLDESEKQMKMMKKKQAELVAQMQNYKNKLKKVAIDNARQNVITQGKMQMHIALLRKQLEDLGVDPIDIDTAVQEFEHSIKIDIVGNRVELWVPGENDIKRLIPDPHEYNKKR